MRLTCSSRLLLAATTALTLAASGNAARAAEPTELRIVHPKGTIIVPASSIIRAEDAGIRAHTNIRLFQPNGHVSPAASAPSGGYENPASLACLYGLTKLVTGCNPTTLTAVATGGSNAIAIVDAYDYPTAVNDLGVYSKQYGLPAITAANFQVVYAPGTKPGKDPLGGGWELEEALDIDMAHALAPNAKIFLVEAKSSSTNDLLAAEKVASQMVAAAGGGEVTNSWGGGETSTEEQMESDFATSGVVYFASTGDSAGTEFPSVLSNVVAVGGTTVNRDASYNYLSQSAWIDTGGGSSSYVPTPSYQAPVSGIVGAKRGAPDISLVADPSTGVWVYSTTRYFGQLENWFVVGGTSVASPATAAIVNNAGNFFASSPAELTQIYNGFKKKRNFQDVSTGTCGNNNKTTPAVAGWDFCTGVGTPYGRVGK